jgi:hypothetical protein
MGKLTPSLAAETEALRKAYAALNRNDIPATVELQWPERESNPRHADFQGGNGHFVQNHSGLLITS